MSARVRWKPGVGVWGVWGGYLLLQSVAMGKSKAPWMDTLAQFLHPVSIEEFFSQYWEKKPLVGNVCSLRARDWLC